MDELNTVQRTSALSALHREIWLAGGCFWGTDEYLSKIRGVAATDVGYANGNTIRPTYQQVCSGKTGYAETVRTVYDPDVLPLKRLLEVFFESIDPCAVNRQGGDVGEQYRTGIFYIDDRDAPDIGQAMSELAAKAAGPLAVQVQKLENYWLAEEYHQDYLVKNPAGYCHIPQSLFDYAKKANT